MSTRLVQSDIFRASLCSYSLGWTLPLLHMIYIIYSRTVCIPRSSIIISKSNIDMHKTWKKNSCAFKLFCPVLNPRHICVKKDIWETFEFALSKFTCWKQRWKGSKKVRWIFPCIEYMYMWSLSCLLYIAELGCVYLETFVLCMHLIVMIYYINFVYHKLRDVFLF